AMEAHSPLIRENCWEWYTSVVRTRMHNDSQELIVFTRWHEEDLIGSLKALEPCVELREWADIDKVEAGGWLHLNFEALKMGVPTEIDPRQAGEALWPERQSVELLETKRRLDPMRFEAMYQGRPTSRGGLLYSDGFAEWDVLPDHIVRRANYTDTADMGDDYLCSVSYAVDADGVIYVLDVVYSREPMEVTENLVADMLQRSEVRSALIESNNGGRGFARAVQRLVPRVKIDWFHQSANKQARILSHSATVVHNVRFPRGWAQCWPDMYAHLMGYKRDFNSNRWHDAADVLTGIVEQESVYERPSRICRFGFM
ncbi:MAG: phage terminase large subunit, partial [Alistipes sp.]|nr:phage terminase large subunit [Alistipes sp.]